MKYKVGDVFISKNPKSFVFNKIVIIGLGDYPDEYNFEVLEHSSREALPLPGFRSLWAESTIDVFYNKYIDAASIYREALNGD